MWRNARQTHTRWLSPCDDSASFPEKDHWQIAHTLNRESSGTGKEKKKRRQGQGQDTSCPGSNLQSVGSLISDKDSVNQEAKETAAWALCLYKTDRASTSVSHFVGIYCSWSQFPCLIITGTRKLESRLRLLCYGSESSRKHWVFIYLFIFTCSYPGTSDWVYCAHVWPRSSSAVAVVASESSPVPPSCPTVFYRGNVGQKREMRTTSFPGSIANLFLRKALRHNLSIHHPASLTEPSC